MSVIFKEKHYDQLLILIKNSTIIILVLVILLTVFNFIFKNKIEVLSKKLENLSKEELKYQTLINNSNNNPQITEDIYSNILIKLAKYAENITFNSIYFKNKIINLNAVSSQQKNIFNLIDNLKADEKFTEVKLLNINQRENFHFQLEILNLQ
jgi:hypothetical protein